MKPLCVSVGKQPDKVVFLYTGRVVVLVYEWAGSSWVHTLLQPLCLCVFLITCPIACSIVLVRKVHNYFPRPVCVGCSLGAPIEYIWWAEVATILVVFWGVLIPTIIICIGLVLLWAIVMTVCISLLLYLSQPINQVISWLVGYVW